MSFKPKSCKCYTNSPLVTPVTFPSRDGLRPTRGTGKGFGACPLHIADILVLAPYARISSHFDEQQPNVTIGFDFISPITIVPQLLQNLNITILKVLAKKISLIIGIGFMVGTLSLEDE